MDNESRHRKFLRWIPLFTSSSSLISQRKVTLYGARARETPEDINEREIRREIRTVLPSLFGGSNSPSIAAGTRLKHFIGGTQLPVISTPALWDSCNALVTSSRFEQVRMFRQWLLPLLKKYIGR